MIHKLVELTEKAQQSPTQTQTKNCSGSGRRRTGAKIAQSSYAEWYRQPCAGWRQK